MKDFKESFKSKNLKLGGYSLLLSAIVIAIAIAVNYTVSALPSTLTKFDMTAVSKYTLSEQTEKIVRGIETDVTIYLIAASGEEDSTLTEILNRYRAMNDKIQIQYKDPALYPTFTQEYTGEAVSSNSLIVTSRLRSKVIQYSDIYVTDYSGYYTTGSVSQSFDAEKQITSAIHYVAASSLPKMYYLTGHGEAQLGSTMEGYIEDDNIELVSLSLLSEQHVPEDCDCLLINSPASDISQEEKALLLSYLESGGKMLILTGQTDTGLTNLYALGAEYGIEASNQIVFEGNSNYYYQYPYYLLPEKQSHTITAPIIDGNYYILQPIAHGLKIKENIRSTLEITGLLQTTDSSYAKADPQNAATLEQEEGDLKGPFYTGIAVTESFDEKETKLVWFSSSNMLDDPINTAVSGANSNLVLNAAGWMCDREETVSIRSVSLDAGPLVVTSGQKNLWTVILCVVLPVGTLAAGFVVWTKRRSRR